MTSALDRLTVALQYPWARGQAGVTIVVGGILTLLSPLVLPGIIVLGYGLRTAGAVMADREHPGGLGNWRALFVLGLKGAIVLVAYVVIPLLVGALLVAAAAGAVGFRFPGRIPTFTGGPAAGGLALVLFILLAGLALVVSYLAPAALLHLARTRRIGAAFGFHDVRRLAGDPAYGSAWLLALAVFAIAGVVLAVLNAAAIGIMVSGFVTFYAFVAMTYLYADGAIRAGVGSLELGE